MKNKQILSLTLLSSLLAACGGSSNDAGGPALPDVCKDLNIEQCNEVTIPESSSSVASSTSSEVPPANDLLPVNEEFSVDGPLQFFSQDYKPLQDPNAEDPNNAFYYATSGLDSGRVLAANGKMTIGNARFTIGQRRETTGTHINPAALPADYKVNTTTDGAASNFPTTTTWGDLDLSHPWKISFCVAEAEAVAGGSVNNQQFMVYVDNNQSGSADSIHGKDSLVKQLNVSNFVAGKRVEINIPGDVFVGGTSVDSVLGNPGTTSSFIQLRVPSAGIVTMSKLWIGYQSDTATEPAASTCAADTRLANWNIPLPAEAPTVAPTAESLDSQLAISWTPLARASSYQLAYNTADSVTGATISTDIAGATTSSYTLNGLVNNQNYFVFLRAKNSAGVTTAWSPSVSAKPQAASVAPVAPAAPALLAGDAQIEVTWSAVEGANSYVVAYNTVDNASTATVFGDATTETSAVLTGLSNDVAYYVFVKAVNSAGESAYSASATATPVAPVATDWEGQVVDLIGGSASPEVGTAPVGSITEEEGTDGTVYVLRASGGVMDSGTGFRTYFASKQVSGEFQFTARIASVTTASGEFTAPGNQWGYGIMVMQDVPYTPVATYASVPRFATLNLFTTSTTPTFNGSRATKADSLTGSRSRTTVDGMTVGDYLRMQVYIDPDDSSKMRIRRFKSSDGVDFGTAVNSTTWSGTVGNDWRIGFYGAPGAEDLFIRFDHVVLEPYVPPVVSSSVASSDSSSVVSSSSSSAASSSDSSVASSSDSSASSSATSSSESSVSSSAASSSESSVSSSSSVDSSSVSSGSGASSSAPWTAEALSLVSGAPTAASGNVSVNQAGTVTLTATGGSLSSSIHDMYFAYQAVAKSDFVFTARIASVSGADAAASNSYRFGLMAIADISPVASYANLGAWADIGFYVDGTPALVGSRANLKGDGTRSRSDISGLAVGNYVRIEIYDDVDGVSKRVRRLTSTDGVTFTQANSTIDFKANKDTDSWFLGLYAAPGVNNLTVTFDNITIEDYVAPAP